MSVDAAVAVPPLEPLKLAFTGLVTGPAAVVAATENGIEIAGSDAPANNGLVLLKVVAQLTICPVAVQAHGACDATNVPSERPAGKVSFTVNVPTSELLEELPAVSVITPVPPAGTEAGVCVGVMVTDDRAEI